MRRPGAALALLLIAFACRLLIPAGFMPVAASDGWRLLPCSGHGPMRMAAAGDRHHPDTPAGHDDQPCGFGALGHALTGGASPPLIAAALAYARLRALLAPAALPTRGAPRLRPPLRAPPA